MLQKRVRLTQTAEISLDQPGVFERFLRLRHWLKSLNSNLNILALAAVAGQLAIAYAALSPAETPEPDGGSTMRLLLPYSAIMLGFLSSYWGLWKADERDDDAPYSPRGAALAERKRLIASLLPTIMGGASMLLPMFLPPTAGVVSLIAGFFVLFGMELTGRRIGMPIADHRGLRWTIGGIAVAILCNVAMARIWNFGILF